MTGGVLPPWTFLDLSQDPDAVVEDDDEEKSYLGAEERATAAFEAVLLHGVKIQGDHHLVFHTRTSSQICVLPPEGLTGARRLRIWKTTCLSRRQSWGIETLRVCDHWEGSGVKPSGVERQIQHGGEIPAYSYPTQLISAFSRTT